MTGLVDPETVEPGQSDTDAPEQNPGLEAFVSPVSETTEDVGEPQGDTPSSDEADDIPEKYRGKSLRDVIEMHQNAEKQIGRSSNEVGELRQVVDTFIKSQMAAASPDNTEEEEDDTDFLVNPKEAVSKAVSSHPAVVEAQKASAQMRAQMAMEKLKVKHPDITDVLNDPGFAEYVKASPVRMKLYQLADTQADFDAADELLSSYKERRSVVQTAAEAEKAGRKQAVKAAATGAGQAASGAPSSKKVFRRADIIKLMQTDPQRYEALQPEIMAAYSEGRVK